VFSSGTEGEEDSRPLRKGKKSTSHIGIGAQARKKNVLKSEEKIRACEKILLPPKIGKAGQRRKVPNSVQTQGIPEEKRKTIWTVAIRALSQATIATAIKRDNY